VLPIYIPSYKRAGRVCTLVQFTPDMLRATTLCVRKEELRAYQAAYATVPVSFMSLPRVDGIGSTRQAIVASVRTPTFVMMDDDITFDTRRVDDPARFTRSTAQEVLQCVRNVEKLLKTYAHAGLLAREGGNRITVPVVYATRMMRVLAYQTDILRKCGARFDRLKFMEDFDVTLTLLRAGHANAVVCTHVQNQKSSNAAGGCSEQRTLDLQCAAAKALHAHHPEFVKLVQKTTKTAWGGATRTDVQVAWKKAYASSCELSTSTTVRRTDRAGRRL